MSELKTQFEVLFKKSGGKAQCASDPKYPNGMAIDVSSVGLPSCTATLPYPAPQCGLWLVLCRRCNTSIVLSAAGRPDDPVSVKFACDASGRRERAAKAGSDAGRSEELIPGPSLERALELTDVIGRILEGENALSAMIAVLGALGYLACEVPPEIRAPELDQLVGLAARLLARYERGCVQIERTPLGTSSDERAN